MLRAGNVEKWREGKEMEKYLRGRQWEGSEK